MKSSAAPVKRRKHQPKPPAIELDPAKFYTSGECCQLLRCSQPTLVRLRRDKGFPLKLIGKGVALGSDIAEWFARQEDRPVIPRAKGGGRKPSPNRKCSPV